nr:LOW QUALITY PROTEIN: T-cell surface glycoprotein CD5 [Columba livia]
MAACPPALSLLLALGLWGALENPACSFGACRCTGVLEVQLKGQWSRVCRDGVSEARAKSICQQLDCGPPVPGPPRLTVTGGKELTHAWTPRCSGPADTLARGTRGPGALNTSALQTSPCREGPCAAGCRAAMSPRESDPLCPPGSRPQALRRLASGPTPCEGDIEVFAEGEWGRQLCRELRCGNLSSSTEIQDPPSMGVTCRVPTLHLCHDKLGVPQTCSRTRVTCQNSKPQPPGLAAGFICLALLLFAILFLICGPPAYRRLMKRSRCRRQWIGPTGLNQTGEESVG